MITLKKDTISAWKDAPDGQSVREFIARNYNRRMSSGGEIISLMYHVERICREEAHWRGWRGYKAGSGLPNVGEHSETVLLTPHTEITISAFYWHMPPALAHRRRLYFSVNGRRVSRATAMAHARSSWEGDYQFEREICRHA